MQLRYTICKSAIHDHCLNKNIYKISASEIIDRYLKGETPTSISMDAGVSHVSVVNVLIRHKIPLRGRSDINHRKYDYEAITKRYLEVGSLNEVAVEFGVKATQIKVAVEKCGFKPKTPKEAARKGIDNPLYKGKSYKGLDGYIILPDGRREHRVIMENKLGRKLSHWEDVHHINEIRTDNREENLAVIPNKEHNRFHTFLRHRRTPTNRDLLFRFCKEELPNYFRFTHKDLEEAIKLWPCPLKDPKPKLIKTCKEKGCNHKAYGKKDICSMHYQRANAQLKGWSKTNKRRSAKLLPQLGVNLPEE